MRGHSLRWKFKAQPSPVSRIYEVRLEFAVGSNAQVFIDTPDLSLLAKGERLPHVYAERPPLLCLHLPGKGEWTPWMRLDETYVPWTYLWLEFFEDWLCDGVWRGGGVHPSRQAA